MKFDRIHAFLIYDCATDLVVPFASLFNMSLQKCIFPNILEYTPIVPTQPINLQPREKKYFRKSTCFHGVKGLRLQIFFLLLSS